LTNKSFSEVTTYW